MRHPPRRERRHAQRCEHEVHADELHRDRHGNGEQHIEADSAEPRACAEPEREQQGVDRPGPREPHRLHPEDLADEQVAQVLAAMNVAGKQ